MSASAGVSGRPATRLGPLLLTAILAQGLMNFDFFAMSLALPSMASDLGTTTTELQWVISGFMISLAALFIPGGRLGDIYGRRSVLVIGLALFGVASLVSGLASSAELVVAARFVQGVGAAAVFPMSIACVSAAVPRERVTRYTGLVFGTAAIGTAIGPFLGGALTEWLSWRWVFFFNTLVAVIVLVLALAFVPQSRDTTAPKRLDVWGVVLVAGGVATATLAADVAGREGWISVPVLGLFALGAGLLVAFVLVERRVAVPLLDLRLFAIREFDVLLVSGTIGNVANVSMILLITMELQEVRDLSPLLAGCAFLAASLGAVVAGQVSGRLAQFPAWRVLTAGLLLAAVGLVGLAVAPGWPTFLVSFFVAGTGAGLAWSFPSVAAQGLVPTKSAGAASGTVLTVLVGVAGVFVAVTATAVEGQTAGGATLGEGIDRVLVALAALAVVGGLATAIFRRAATRT